MGVWKWFNDSIDRDLEKDDSIRALLKVAGVAAAAVGTVVVAAAAVGTVVVGGSAVWGLIDGSPSGPVIGPGSTQSALRGHEAQVKLPRSHASVEQVTLAGNKLKVGQSYQFNDVSLKIIGNVPKDVTIWGSDGQLLVTGNAGNNDSFRASVEEFTEDCGAYCGVHDTGPKPPFNKDPAIVVEGKVGSNVQMIGSNGIIVTQRP